MRNRRNIYIYVGRAVVLLLLLWTASCQNKTTVFEKSPVENQTDLTEIETDTIPAFISQDAVTVVEKKPIRKTIPPPPPQTLKPIAKKSAIVKLRKDTMFPDLTLAPLRAEALLRNDESEELVELQLMAMPVRKTKAEVEDAWKSDTLPVKKGIDMLRIKKVGRFDRGIVNYRFMPKGQTMVGLDASFWNFDSQESKLLFAYLDNFTFNARTISINPFIGYFFKDNQSIGMKWGYRQTSGNLSNVSIKIDEDVNFSLKDLGLNEEIYSCTFFHRSYIGLDAGKRFGLFNETSLNIGYGKSVFTRGANETLKETTTKILEARLGISPGLAVFIMENVSVECSIGIMGLKYRQEKQSNNLGEKGQHLNGGANFKINLFDLNLGLIISL